MSTDRKFNIGRQSEQLYNEELFKMFESIKHLLAVPDRDKTGPESSLHGALWLDMATNELKYYNKTVDSWDNIFRDKFQIVDGIMNQFPPSRPVFGQLWINHGVLMYYDGLQWSPIKALMQDGAEINLSTFEDFLQMSPLHPPGNTIFNDGVEVPQDELQSQFLVPNLDAGKFFVEREFRFDAEDLNKVTIQYPKDKLVDKAASWVHINPGKLTRIKKRIYKIDKFNQQLYTDPFNTEFYGFRRDSHLGHYLRPGNEEEGDYYVTPDGIFLSYNAAQSFDYVLGVSYEFSWIKSSGRLKRTSTDDAVTNYYVGGFGGPINVFIEGYDLENQYYHYDTLTQTLAVKDPDMEQDLDVSIMQSIQREYGLIRERTLDGKGIIRMRNRYINPIVFVNGQALHSSMGDITIDNVEGIILVNGARRDMSYCIMETENAETGERMFLQSGTVQEIIDRQGIIRIADMANKIKVGEGLILFVDGLMIRKEDIVRDYIEGAITVHGLERGQEYVLLLDKEHRMQLDDDQVYSALVTGRVDESLLFMNNHLLCNDTALVTTRTEAEEADTAVTGEVKLFLTPGEDKLQGRYKIYSEYDGEWKDCDSATIAALKKFAFSYENGINIISINIPFTKEDRFEVYAYNFANTIEKPLIINTVMADNQMEFPLLDHFQANTNSLQVFLDGVRQYDDKVEEYFDGSGFRLTAPFTGRVTYIIEHPENGAQRSCIRDILRKEDALAGSPNVYKTHVSLYPGRLTVYASGLRMPKESYTILDNFTILFKDEKERLIGSKDTYPEQSVLKADGKTVATVKRTQPDEILIEIRESFDREERTVTMGAMASSDIPVESNGLPHEILEASDEILIFVNGVFAGLRNDIGYMKNRHHGAITILNGDVMNVINHDPLYKLFMMQPAKHILWQQRNGGKPYAPKIENKITLEWR